VKNHFRLGRNLLLVSFILLALQPFGLREASAQAAELFVSPSGSGTDCTQANPCDAGQAMTNAVTGDTIYFMGGTYTSTNDPYLVINKAVSLMGGWDGSPTGDVVVDPAAYPTTLNGEDTRSLFTVNDTSGAGELITITGFTFQNGKIYLSGGAIRVREGRVTIQGNIFRENSSDNYGGAIGVESGFDVQILGNSFYDNEVVYGGGSISIGSSDPDNTTCVIDGNYFSGGYADYGSVISNSSSTMIVNRNTFVDTLGESVIMVSSTGPTSIISNNFIIRPAQNAIHLMNSSSVPHQIVNNTIIGSNYGLFVYNNALVNVVNNIITGTNQSIRFTGGTLTGSNNLFYDNTSDPNPLTDPVYADPEFIDPLADDYHIGEDSPAVNAGTTVALDEDYDGDARPSGGGYDIGADEIEGGCLAYLPLVLK